MTQTQIPLGLAESASAPCRWCGAASTGTFEVAPSKLGTYHGREVTKWRMVAAPACAGCLKRLQEPVAPVAPVSCEQMGFDLGEAA